MSKPARRFHLRENSERLEVALNIHPVLLGSGVPLFHDMKKQIDLELLDSKVLQDGYLVVTYRVKQ